MVDTLHAIEWDVWIINTDQEDINQICKEMLSTTIAIDLVILPNSAEVKIRIKGVWCNIIKNMIRAKVK